MFLEPTVDLTETYRSVSGQKDGGCERLTLADLSLCHYEERVSQATNKRPLVLYTRMLRRVFEIS